MNWKEEAAKNLTDHKEKVEAFRPHVESLTGSQWGFLTMDRPKSMINPAKDRMKRRFMRCLHDIPKYGLTNPYDIEDMIQMRMKDLQKELPKKLGATDTEGREAIYFLCDKFFKEKN